MTWTLCQEWDVDRSEWEPNFQCRFKIPNCGSVSLGRSMTRIVEAEPDDDRRLILALVDPVVRYSLVDDDPICAEDWKPTSPQLKEIMSLLTSDALRPALIKWYSDSPERVNPFAERFTQILERETGLTLRNNEAQSGR